MCFGRSSTSSKILSSKLKVEIDRTIAELREAAPGMTKTKLKETMKMNGIGKLHFVLDDAHMPGADYTTDAMADIMHIWGCGLSR